MTRADKKLPSPVREELDFAEIYRNHAAFLWRCLRRLGVREGDVEDVCQETFVTAHRKLAEFDGSSALRTWLFGIALRKASEYRRRRHVRSEEPREAADLEQASAPTQVEELVQRQARAVLDDVLAQLDDDKRATFVLYELEQLPMSEVAELLDCPLQTAYSRLHAARRTVEQAVRRFRLKEGIA